jgi:biotin operon repressor
MPDARPAEAPSIAEGTAPRTTAPRAGETDERFWLALSDGQVQDLVLQEAASRGAGRGLVGVLLTLSGIGRRVDLEELMRDERYHDRRISQSVIRGLLVLGAFASGEAHGLNDLAAELGMGRTTLWRYLRTWVAAGALEERQDRRYQLARRWRQELSIKVPRRAVRKTE